MAKRYSVTAYSRYSSSDDKVVKHKTGLGPRAAAKIAVTMARGRGIDAGVAVREESFDRHRVGQVTSSGAYAGEVAMRCHAQDPNYGRSKGRRSVIKCETKPEFKAEIKAARSRRR